MGVKTVMVSGKVKLYVTCFHIRSSSPNLQVKVIFSFLFFLLQDDT